MGAAEHIFFSATHPTPSNSTTNSLEKPKQKDDNSITTSTTEPSKTETNSTSTNDNALPPPTLSKFLFGYKLSLRSSIQTSLKSTATNLLKIFQVKIMPKSDSVKRRATTQRRQLVTTNWTARKSRWTKSSASVSSAMCTSERAEWSRKVSHKRSRKMILVWTKRGQRTATTTMTANWERFMWLWRRAKRTQIWQRRRNSLRKLVSCICGHESEAKYWQFFPVLCRYHAEVRASAHNPSDWHMQFVADMDCDGIGKIRGTASVFKDTRKQVSGEFYFENYLTPSPCLKAARICGQTMWLAVFPLPWESFSPVTSSSPSSPLPTLFS